MSSDHENTVNPEKHKKSKKSKDKSTEKHKKEKKKDESETDGTALIDLELLKTNPDKLYPLIYYALKRVLKEWEEALDERPGT